MNNPEKQQSSGDRDVDDQQKSTEDSSSASCRPSGSDSDTGDSSTRRNGNGNGIGIGLAARLTDLFVGNGDNDDDLLTQRSSQEGTVMQWLQTLDMQVMGACRADERLKPLLKLNVCSGVAEDRLLSHLSQHFEPSEVGLLARCLCVPLVSVRVGKIDKQGTLLIPNSARGNLTLSLLPTSNLRISFIGDDGHVERLLTLRNISDCSSVVIEGISADTSGRSFIIKVPTAEPFYFWVSEKSRLLGDELLEKMMSLLEKKPSLTDLTGISESRLESFVTHLRTYFSGSNTQTALESSFSTTSLNLDESCKTLQSPSLTSKSSRSSLSPRPSSFKEGPPKKLVTLKNVMREKFKRKEVTDSSSNVVQTFETLSVPSSSTNTSLNNKSVESKIPESNIDTHLFPLVRGLEVGLDEKPISTPLPPMTPPPLFSPYYCWCPPSMPESFTLPPLSSLSTPTLLTPSSTLNLDEIPPFLPMSMPTSQQILTFTPLMTDPIVHIPVIDICSSGQAYLVSGGPVMNVTIPLVTPLIQETDSMAEKSARDTLRLLISGSSQLPSVLSNTDGNANVFTGGSRGLYGGAADVNHAIANSIAAMGMVSLTDRSGCIDQGDLVDLLGEPVDSGGTFSNSDESSLSDSGESQ